MTIFFCYAGSGFCPNIQTDVLLVRTNSLEILDGLCKENAEVCSKCSGPSDTDCIICDPGYYFSLSNRQCFKCHEGCKVCTGPNDYE